MNEKEQAHSPEQTVTNRQVVEHLRGVETQLEQYLAAVRLTITLLST